MFKPSPHVEFSSEEMKSIVIRLQLILNSFNLDGNDNESTNPALTISIFPFSWPETFDEHKLRCEAICQATEIKFTYKLISLFADPIDLLIDMININIAAAPVSEEIDISILVGKNDAAEEKLDHFLTSSEEELFQRFLMFEFGILVAKRTAFLAESNADTKSDYFLNSKDSVQLAFSAEATKLRQKTVEILAKRYAKGFLTDDAYNLLLDNLKKILNDLEDHDYCLPEKEH